MQISHGSGINLKALSYILKRINGLPDLWQAFFIDRLLPYSLFANPGNRVELIYKPVCKKHLILSQSTYHSGFCRFPVWTIK